MNAAHAQDATELLLRLDRLESDNRRLNGQIEQLQFQIKRQEDQLKRFQADADLRFKDLEGGKGPSRPVQQIQPSTQPPLAPPPQKRSDAANLYPAPQAGTPGNIASSTTGLAPGPRPLSAPGGTLSDKPVRTIPGAGAVANPNGSIIDDDGPVPLGRPTTPRYTPQGAGQTASFPSGSAKDVFDSGRSALDRGEFEQAEVSFKEFIRAHPRDKLVPDATFGLGESFFSRRKYTDAAEQYLNLTTKYGQSPRAAEGMLKLGMSLRSLGSVQEACATLNEVLRRYPSANASVKAAVTRERSRAKCVG